MDLFSEIPEHHITVISTDGEAIYYKNAFLNQEAQDYFDALFHNIEWKNDEINLFGKNIITNRKVAWYGDPGLTYTYSKITKEALLWTNELLVIKNKIENITGEKFNSCLLNLYHNGNEGMGWHTDNEKELKENGAIASVSFGANRKFSFKHKTTKENVSLILENGSILVMKGTLQKHWLHCLPKSKKVTTARINLTFRQIK